MDDPSLNLMNEQDKSEERLPPGFRFHPTDEELVTYYLTKKILDSSFSGRAITEVDLNKSEPWDLPGKAKMGEKEWYFFSLRDRKYPTGLRTNRATDAGYWKTTGKDREIFNSRTSSLVGMKKTLVFYKGRAPKGEKTNWVMHEYRLEGKFSYHRLPKNSKDEWVVCRIFQKSAAGGKKNSTGLGRISYLDLGSPSLPSLLESPYNATAVINEQEMGSIESESGNSAKVHVPCFSTACMEAAIRDTNGRGLMGSGTLHHHVQVQRGGIGSSNPHADTAELSDVARIAKSSSYMQNNNIMLNDLRFNMNLMPSAALSSLSSLRRDQNALYQQPAGMQYLPALAPPLLFSQMSGLSSLNSQGRGNASFPLDANISAHSGLPSNAILRAMINHQSAGINNVSLKQTLDQQMDPSTSSYGVHADKSSADRSLETGTAFHWVSNDATSQHQHQQQHIGSLEGNAVSDQRVISSQSIRSIPHEQTCLSTDMNGENMSSVVCNNNNRPFDQVDPSSAAAPLDLESFWNY